MKQNKMKRKGKRKSQKGNPLPQSCGCEDPTQERELNCTKVGCSNTPGHVSIH